ncbi:MAG TPA: WhiB family transcriptional regulator [Streptosporangiaceae bacterium]|nr:WhiB family transcriptional regulator [Streptosporangiaceae bacterium]
MIPATRPGTGPQASRQPRALRSVPEPDLPCRADPDLFFAEHPAEIDRARELCGGCPVRVACLARALANREPWGVWGGEILHRGAIIADKRGRGRPRKADIA